MNVAEMFGYLQRQHGMSPHHAAAMLGNFKQESSFNPAAYNKGEDAYGFGQWRGDRLANLRRMYGNNPTPQQQLDFAVWEGTQGPEQAAWSKFMAAPDVASAAAAFDKHYERSAGHHTQNRINYANAIMSGPASMTMSSKGSSLRQFADESKAETSAIAQFLTGGNAGQQPSIGQGEMFGNAPAPMMGGPDDVRYAQMATAPMGVPGQAPQSQNLGFNLEGAKPYQGLGTVDDFLSGAPMIGGESPEELSFFQDVGDYAVESYAGSDGVLGSAASDLVPSELDEPDQAAIKQARRQKIGRALYTIGKAYGDLWAGREVDSAAAYDQYSQMFNMDTGSIDESLANALDQVDPFYGQMYRSGDPQAQQFAMQQAAAQRREGFISPLEGAKFDLEREKFALDAAEFAAKQGATSNFGMALGALAPDGSNLGQIAQQYGLDGTDTKRLHDIVSAKADPQNKWGMAYAAISEQYPDMPELQKIEEATKATSTSMITMPDQEATKAKAALVDRALNYETVLNTSAAGAVRSNLTMDEARGAVRDIIKSGGGLSTTTMSMTEIGNRLASLGLGDEADAVLSGLGIDRVALSKLRRPIAEAVLQFTRDMTKGQGSLSDRERIDIAKGTISANMTDMEAAEFIAASTAMNNIDLAGRDYYYSTIDPDSGNYVEVNRFINKELQSSVAPIVEAAKNAEMIEAMHYAKGSEGFDKFVDTKYNDLMVRFASKDDAIRGRAIIESFAPTLPSVEAANALQSAIPTVPSIASQGFAGQKLAVIGGELFMFDPNVGQFRNVKDME